MSQISAEAATVLYQVARNLLQERDYGELLTSVLDMTIQALGADRGCVVVHENNEFRASVARNFRNEDLSEREREISSSVANMAVSEGKMLLINDAQESELLRDKKSVRRLHMRSVLCAPLIVSSGAFALIYLENRGISNHFQEHHETLLSEICALATPRLHTAVAIETARQKVRDALVSSGESDGILTVDPAMMQVLETLAKVAPTDLPVLIQGESGTGKELLARSVYRRSTRANGPFVTLNCAAIPAQLIESELFGYLRGAFTGAHRDRIGLIGSANRGTLFLDEVGEMPLDLQSRLLRVLQSGDFNRLGSTRMERVDVRVISATNRNLDEEIERGRFRQDLYFRLSSVTLKVPPLRERPADLVMLVDHFLRVYSGRWARGAPRVGQDCLQVLLSYPFPGNVRELEGEMARLVAMCAPDDEILAAALNDRISRRKPRGHTSNFELKPMSLAQMEKELIVKVLQQTFDNRTRAAEILGISREGLRVKMQKFGLTSTAVRPGR